MPNNKVGWLTLISDSILYAITMNGEYIQNHPQLQSC